MFLKLLGSAAAEGWPALFCACEACREARRLGGKNLRRRTSYQLGDTVHVDFGPDSFSSMLAFGLDYTLLRHLLITHAHQDHWFPEELAWRRAGYSRHLEDCPLVVHGNRHVQDSLRDQFHELESLNLSFQPVKAYERVALTDELSAIGFPASHASEEELALNYLFTWRDRNLVIGNDTGWWLPEVWDFLQGFPLHLVVMDCTSGPSGTGPRAAERSWVGSHHLNNEWVVEVRDELARRGALAEDCTFVANHFSHNGGALHEQLEEYFVPRGILVGYDGMAVSL